MSSTKKATTTATTSNAESGFDDRRSHPRYAFTAAAEVIDIKSHTRMNTRISDLGLKGCYVDTNSPFPLGTVVKIRVTNASKTFETNATVVYSLANMGMGLAFAPPEPEQLWVLQKWIGELSGETPCEFDHSVHDATQRADPSSAESQRYVLQELLTTLMQKGTLTNFEGTALLQRLLR